MVLYGYGQGSNHQRRSNTTNPLTTIKPMTTITCIFVSLLTLITLPIIILLWATESKQQKAKRMRARGKSYKTIATLINVSPTTARRYALACGLRLHHHYLHHQP